MANNRCEQVSWVGLTMQSSRKRVWLFFLAAAGLTVSATFSQETPPREEEAVPAAVAEELEILYRFESTGTVEQTERGRLHIRTEAGRQSFGQLFFPFRAELHELSIHYVRTIKPTGQIVEALLEQPIELTPLVVQQAPMFSDLKFKVVPVRGLQVGDRLEYEVITKTRVPLKPGDFWAAHYPTRHLPVLSERVTLDLPADRAVILKADETVAHTVEESDGRIRHHWTLANPKPQEGRALQQPLFTLSSLATWSDVGRWYRDLQTDRAVLTPELQSLARKIVNGMEDPQQKLEAIYRYVAQSIRYVSISLGLGGYQSHRATEIWQNQYGDCKDKHTLLAVLLSAVGLEAYPALISTILLFEPAVPSPGQFDHVISVVLLDDRWLWLDTTQEVALLGFLPRDQRGKQALVVLSKESCLVETPQESPIPEQRHVSLSGEVNPKGTLIAKLRYEVRGEVEVAWRQLFRRANSEEIELTLRLARPYTFWKATTEPLTRSDPLDLAGPFMVEYPLTQKRFVNPLRDSDRVELPKLFLEFPPWKLPDKEPKVKAKVEEEIDLGGPVELEEEVELTVAPVFQMHVPISMREDREFADYESAYELREGKLVARRVLRVHQAKLPAARGAELESFAKLIERDRSQEVLFERLGEVDYRALAEEMTPDELNEVGRNALNKGQVLLARDLFEKATQKDPQHKWAWNNLGLAYLRMERLDEAQAAFEKQIEVNPRDEYAYNNLGSVFQRRDRYDEAIRAFEKQIEINPQDRYAHTNLAHVYAKLERWSEAEAECDKAVSITPGNAHLYVLRGRAQLRQGKRNAAHASFERALELSGEPATYNNIAYALAESGQDLDLALRYAQSAVVRIEAELRVLTSLKGWRRTMALQSSLSTCLANLGWILFQRDQLQQAALYLEASFELVLNPKVAEYLARLRAVQGQPAEALRYYAYAVHLPWSPRVKAKLPAELEPYVREELGGDEALERKLEEMRVDTDNLQRLQPEEGAFTWPADAPEEVIQSVRMHCLVDEAGRVEEAEVFSGTEPWRRGALHDVKKLRFPPVTWNGGQLKTIRAIEFSYKPGRTVEARRFLFLFPLAERGR